MGLFPNSLIISIVGRPKVGKTFLACNHIFELSRMGKRVLVFSLDMDQSQLIQRIDQIHRGMDMKELLSYYRSHLSPPAGSHLDDNVFVHSDCRRLDVMEQAICHYRPNWVYIDHATCIDSAGNPIYLYQADVFARLKQWRDQYGIRIAVLVQPKKREGKAVDGSEMPYASDAYGGDIMVQTVDLAIGICRPGLDSKSGEGPDIIRMGALCSRHTVSGVYRDMRILPNGRMEVT